MALSNCRILVTGANGFIGKNFVLCLEELANITISTFVRGDEVALLPKLLSKVDAVVHLAGENRPADEVSFAEVNSGLTLALCDAVEQVFRSTGQHVPIILASSIQADFDNSYGRSKLAAEASVQALANVTGNPCVIFRLPGVFGKWCKPNYNSVIATFCHNITRDLPIQINDATVSLRLVYIDDVVTALLAALEAPKPGCVFAQVEPCYIKTLGAIADLIHTFVECRSTLMMERVGTGFVRALYATYVSYLPVEKFSYQVAKHTDSRGVFVNMLKTPDNGQFSYFTTPPGFIWRGHYCHTKTQKFLVVKGEALFHFRHLLTNKLVELRTCGDTPEVVDTIPGWSHDITNLGNDELVMMLWANENSDNVAPNTFTRKVIK